MNKLITETSIMKKALVIMNGVYPNHAVITSAVNVAKLSPTTLHAFFLTQESGSPEGDYLFPNDLSLTQNNVTGDSIREDNTALLDDNINLLKALCEREGIQYLVEPHRPITIQEILNFSAFADFIIADANSGLYQYSLSDLLADAHCPVLLSSSRIEEIPRIVFAYDGSYSSIYAFKMFSYIFPEWVSMQTNLIHFSSDQEATLPHEALIRGWLQKHYPAARTSLLQGKGHRTLIDYLNE